MLNPQMVSLLACCSLVWILALFLYLKSHGLIRPNIFHFEGKSFSEVDKNKLAEDFVRSCHRLISENRTSIKKNQNLLEAIDRNYRKRMLEALSAKVALLHCCHLIPSLSIRLLWAVALSLVANGYSRQSKGYGFYPNLRPSYLRILGWANL